MPMKRIAAAAMFALAALGLAAGGATAWAQGKGRDKHEQRQQGDKPKKQHKHKDGKSLLGDRIKQNGRHKIDQNGKYSTFVETHNGKIRSVKVNHSDKGDVPVTKYKTSKRMAEAGSGFVRVGMVLVQSLGSTWIGYSYYDEYGDEVIYWFEYEMIEDPYTGAVEYVPVY
jgi:hypothetical protein